MKVIFLSGFFANRIDVKPFALDHPLQPTFSLSLPCLFSFLWKPLGTKTDEFQFQRAGRGNFMPTNFIADFLTHWGYIWTWWNDVKLKSLKKLDSSLAENEQVVIAGGRLTCWGGLHVGGEKWGERTRATFYSKSSLFVLRPESGRESTTVQKEFKLLGGKYLCNWAH